MPASPNIETLPIFPLNNVLFPLGKMNLRIFEPRYMDMIGGCMQTNSSFGICLIAEGKEVGTAAVPHKTGTEARIIDWDMSHPGVLGITVRGERRFHLQEQTVDAQQKITGQITWLEEPATSAISEIHQSLLPLMQLIIADAGEQVIPPPRRLEDPAWLGYRYAEILPIPPLARQRLLELEDAELRLSIIQAYLKEHQLLKRDTHQ